MFSQQIVIDDSVDLESLIQNNLVDGCVDISNISSSVNGSNAGLSSYGYFERGNSNFPFERGIVLTTGRASSGGNSLTTPTLSEGSSTWGTDPDLEAALGVSGTLNATSIEFDFISISNQFQFNYLFASEEYFGEYPCTFSDGFVFLIKEAGTSDPYQNIALVPNTTVPVNTNTIHNEIFGLCEAQNSQYFEGYNLGDTNYNGRTTVLSATGNIQPNVTYHIKLIIADQTDSTFDSAVFIEGDSFRVLDLGEDISTCASTVNLDADLENPLASYAWYLNGNLISGATSSTYTATQSGTYQVVVSVPVNGANCSEQDEIEVVLSTEEPIDPISDYEICDDSSGDGIEVFDLSTKDAELIPNIPFTNYDFSYHYSETDARNNSNPITTPIANTANPQTIFIRIQDQDSACFAYTSFNLVVNSLPNITPPTPLESCDTDEEPDGFAVVDLSEKTDEITNGQSDLLVTYHYTPLDAISGDNPIINDVYINSNTPTDNIYVRVINTVTGCTTTTNLQVNITISPIVNRDTQYLDACDSDLDGQATFDLTEVIPAVLDGLPATEVSTTFYTSLEDAQNNTNAIANETNYLFTNAVAEPGSGTLYLRIENNATGCATIVDFEVHTNLLLTGTNTGDYALCDNNDDETDSLSFNLFTVENYIANELPNSISVTFYETENDRDNNINPIDKSQPYVTQSPKVLFISITDNDSGCVENSQITLLINPILLFNNVTIPYCDTDNDGFASIELAALDDIITGGNDDFTVSYFETEADANNNINQLPPFYNNTNPTETLYARITNRDSGCSTVNPFSIEVLVAPEANQPTDIIICDDDQDGLSEINLNAKISEIVANTTGLDIDFFTTIEDAEAKTNEIPESQRNAYTTGTQTIYVRIEDLNSPQSCYALVSFEVIVNTLPIFPNISNYQICEDDNDRTADFLLSEKDDEILNGQTGKEVYYFSDPGFTNPIDKTLPYQNTSSPQTIYVRVENISDPSCNGTSSFTIEVAPEPVYNPIIDFLICDDESNDGKHVFDLAQKAQEIQSGLPDLLNISFHLSRNMAETNTNPLPATYTNATNPQSLYVRIESDDSLCYTVEELGINIIAAPDVMANSPSLTECAPDYNGIANFDLTYYNIDTQTDDFEIRERVKSNISVDYFENETDINPYDGLDNTNAIADPTNFSSTAKTIYIKVSNTLSGCFSVVPLELKVNMPPPTNTLNTIEICDNDTKTYNLSLIDDLIVNNPENVTISYHNSADDAQNNVNPLGNIYTYTANSHIIYVRVNNPVTGCFISKPVTLQINPNPIAQTPPNLIDCDDDYDGFLIFDLSQNNSAILGTLNPSDFNITFYSSEEDAANGSNRLNPMYNATNGETIYVRLQNIATGCYSTTQFNTIINPLPVIPIEDIVPICNNTSITISADTGVSGASYLWSTGETTPEIVLGPNDIGSYSVTVTHPNPLSNDCSYTHNFEVIESSQATINFTQTVDFADPNSITVNVSGIGNYVYILDDGQPQTSNIFEDVSFGPHTVTVRDLYGCLDATSEVFVIDIPKFFTPNNDGAYDTWHIVGANQLPGTVVYIYNRYGKLLKTLSHSSVGWDGTYNGQNMPSDDYWFVAKIVQNGQPFQIKGHFALKR